MAAGVGVLGGVLLFDSAHLLTFRPRWFDLPMLLWCFSRCFASLANGLGLYDGLSEALSLTLIWGVPYLIGRLYFGGADGLRAFAVGHHRRRPRLCDPCLL